MRLQVGTNIPNLLTKDKLKDRLNKRSARIATKIQNLIDMEERQDQLFFLLAVLPSFVAYFAYKDVSLALSCFLNDYGHVPFGEIDGNLFAINLLRPAITGVVVPVIAVALATLVSTTINVLREREVQLRTLINKESCDLRLLRSAIFGLFGTRQHASRRARAMALVCSYVEEVEKECNVGAVESLQGLQYSGGIANNELGQLTEMLHGIDGAAASRQGSVGYADNLVRSLNDYRSERVAELLSGFPAIHWGVLIALSLSVCAAFLLAAIQPMDAFLDSVSLRALFALLVGVCSGTATICLDLADPFRGTFSILEASAQLADLRLCLEEDIAEATAEAGEIPSSLVHAILEIRENNNNLLDTKRSVGTSTTTSSRQSGTSSEQGEQQGGDLPSSKPNNKQPPRRYGLLPTLYFHLLTGPLGSYVRPLGDAIAWLATFVSRRIINSGPRFGRNRWWRRRNNATSS